MSPGKVEPLVGGGGGGVSPGRVEPLVGGGGGGGGVPPATVVPGGGGGGGGRGWQRVEATNPRRRMATQVFMVMNGMILTRKQSSLGLIPFS